jgi:cobalt-zinc-cadmium efflux system outer membrane protein
LAAAIRRYEDTYNLVQRYREQMLPRAQRAYDLYVAGVRQMAAAYPQALIARRTLLQLEVEYDDALGEVWTTVVSLQGLLLEGGLSAPGVPVENDSEARPSGNGLNRGQE